MQGFRDDQIAAERFLNLRYDGTDVAVMTSRSSDSTYTEAFESAYKREFGFILEGRGIRVCCSFPLTQTTILVSASS